MRATPTMCKVGVRRILGLPLHPPLKSRLGTAGLAFPRTLGIVVEVIMVRCRNVNLAAQVQLPMRILARDVRGTVERSRTGEFRSRRTRPWGDVGSWGVILCDSGQLGLPTRPWRAPPSIALGVYCRRLASRLQAPLVSFRPEGLARSSSGGSHEVHGLEQHPRYDPLKKSVYVETSVVSYLTARRSRDAVISRNQSATRTWWQVAQQRFELVASTLVVDEAGLGDRSAAIERLNALKPLRILEVRDEARALTRAFIRNRAVPQGAVDDALHIATAVVHGVEYLATWNLKHIANAESIARVEQVCKNEGYEPIIIGTPRQLMSEQHD